MPEQPTLKRTRGGFQVFAITFAFISVAVGVFATFGDLLQTAGPVGFWLWIASASRSSPSSSRSSPPASR